MIWNLARQQLPEHNSIAIIEGQTYLQEQGPTFARTSRSIKPSIESTCLKAFS